MYLHFIKAWYIKMESETRGFRAQGSFEKVEVIAIKFIEAFAQIVLLNVSYY